MNEWKDLLVFNRRERNGILLLTTCVVFFSAVRFLVSQFREENSLIAKIQSMDLSEKFEAVEHAENDPGNTNHDLELTNLPEVELDSFSYPMNEKFGFTKSDNIVTKTELNNADSMALEKLPWIGGKLAARIIKYRNSLGGFHSINQLKEIYGLSPEAYDVIDSLCTVNPKLVNTLNINQDSVEYLFHPYLTKRQWNSITAFIRKHGPVSNCDYLKQTLVLNDDEIAKLCPYLDFN